MESMTIQPPSLRDEIDASLAWWRAAGVDCDFTDDATAWLIDAAEVEAVPADQGGHATTASDPLIAGATGEEEKPARGEPVDLLGDLPPSTLAEFHEFWASAPGLDPIGPRGRIPPRGNANPEVMVLVIDPEEADRDQLLSGPQGRLLANMLNAMSLSDDQVYYASALPRHTPMADTTAANQAGLGAVLALHVQLVAPKKLIAFGSNILPLLQHGITKGETSLREINQNSSSHPLMVSEGLDSLMAMPRLKARFWRRWNEWSVMQ